MFQQGSSIAQLKQNALRRGTHPWIKLFSFFSPFCFNFSSKIFQAQIEDVGRLLRLKIRQGVSGSSPNWKIDKVLCPLILLNIWQLVRLRALSSWSCVLKNIFFYFWAFRLSCGSVTNSLFSSKVMKVKRAPAWFLVLKSKLWRLKLAVNRINLCLPATRKVKLTTVGKELIFKFFVSLGAFVEQYAEDIRRAHERSSATENHRATR